MSAELLSRVGLGYRRRLNFKEVRFLRIFRRGTPTLAGRVLSQPHRVRVVFTSGEAGCLGSVCGEIFLGYV